MVRLIRQFVKGVQELGIRPLWLVLLGAWVLYPVVLIGWFILTGLLAAQFGTPHPFDAPKLGWQDAVFTLIHLPYIIGTGVLVAKAWGRCSWASFGAGLKSSVFLLPLASLVIWFLVRNLTPREREFVPPEHSTPWDADWEMVAQTAYGWPFAIYRVYDEPHSEVGLSLLHWQEPVVNVTWLCFMAFVWISISLLWLRPRPNDRVEPPGDAG